LGKVDSAPELLTTGPRPHAAAAAGPADAAPSTLEQLEARAIERALARHGGHRQRAADELGIGVRTLYEKLKRYGLS
jgi:two-component system response regulator FlrC